MCFKSIFCFVIGSTSASVSVDNTMQTDMYCLPGYSLLLGYLSIAESLELESYSAFVSLGDGKSAI